MSVPTYDRFIEPIVRFLATRPDGVPAREAHDAAAEALLLTESDREHSLPTGQATYKNRAGWAHDRLKRAGYSTSPKHGVWCLTAAGRKFVADNPAPLSPTQVVALARNYLDVKLNPDVQGARTGPMSEGLQPNEVQSPDDRLQTALAEIRTSVSSELLDLLLQVSPKYFETVVLDLLHKLGYGTSRSDLQRVGGSGDGGIDGVISLDRLGLEKSMYRPSVGRAWSADRKYRGFTARWQDSGRTRGCFSQRPASPRRRLISRDRLSESSWWTARRLPI